MKKERGGIIAKRIARKNELSNSIKERVEEFVVNISNKPSDSSNDYSGRYVKAGENVESVMGQVIAKFIDNVINKTSLVKHVSVAQDQLADLQDTNRDFKTNIRVEQVEHILSRPKNKQTDQVLLRIDPLNMCRPQDFPYENCIIESGNSNGHNPIEENNEPMTKEDLHRYTYTRRSAMNKMANTTQ